MFKRVARKFNIFSSPEVSSFAICCCEGGVRVGVGDVDDGFNRAEVLVIVTVGGGCSRGATHRDADKRPSDLSLSPLG